MAIENNWGGGDSVDKKNQMIEFAIDLFQKRWDKNEDKWKVYKDELSIDYEDMIDEFFCMDCDDGSIDEISETLCNIYTKCRNGDVEDIKKMIETYPAHIKNASIEMKSALNEMEESDDEDYDDDEDEDEDAENW